MTGEGLTPDALCAEIERIARLDYQRECASRAGESWETVRGHIVALQEAQSGIGWPWARDVQNVHPLYWSVDDGDICGAYAIAGDDVTAVRFARGVLDLIAEDVVAEADLNATWIERFNWDLLVTFYGEAVIGPGIAALRDALANHREDYVRFERSAWPCDEAGEEIVGEGEPPLRAAPIDTTDSEFQELGFMSCGADAEHATRIIRCDIDMDITAELKKLVSARSKAARDVLRGALLAVAAPQ